MEAVLFIGLQAAGKSTFYKDKFFRTHVRINLDMLRTRHRESVFLRACLDTRQTFVVDNTNPTAESRSPYIQAARAAGFGVVGYYFRTGVEECRLRNAARPEEDRVPEVAIFATGKRLQPPSYAEGFDQLWSVQAAPGGGWEVLEWADEAADGK